MTADHASRWTECFTAGMVVLPLLFGLYYDSFEVFSLTLAVMLVAMIVVTIGIGSLVAPPGPDDPPPP